MHEARLCLSLIRMAEQQLDRNGAERVLALRLEVGTLSGVVPEALASAFPICARESRADGAELHLEPVPGRDLVLRRMEVR